MTDKRFLVTDSDYDLKYEFRIADLNRVTKTKEDFWDNKEECYNHFKYYDYLYEHNAFLTVDEADILFNELNDENERLRILLKHNEDSTNYDGFKEELINDYYGKCGNILLFCSNLLMICVLIVLIYNLILCII